MRDISKNIKDLRIAKNITQEQLAEKLFVTRQTVSNYETGKSRPDIDMIIKISEVLESDVNSVIYGVTDNVRKKEYIKLAVGAVLTLFVIVLSVYLAPVTIQLKNRYYLSSFSFLIGFTLTPLTWLLVGWTIMQLASIAFKTRVPAPQWTKYVRRILLMLIAIYFVLVLFTLLPTAIEDFIYLMEKNKNIHTSYSSNISASFSFFRDWLVNNVLYKLVSPNDMRIPVFLSLGISLWLCGFPCIKKWDNTNTDENS